MVTALAAAPNGAWLASADWVGDSSTGKGSLYLWDLRGGKAQVRQRDLGAKVLCLSFSPDGGTLVAGTAATGRPREVPRNSRCGRPRRSNASVGGLARTKSRRAPWPPTASNWPTPAAWAGEVFCEPDRREPGSLGCFVAAAGVSTRWRLPPRIRCIAWHSARNTACAGWTNSLYQLQESFDPQRLALSPGARSKRGRGAVAGPGRRRLDRQANGSGVPPTLSRRQAQGRVVLDTVLSPKAPQRCYCWVPDERESLAIAVGTEPLTASTYAAW